MYKKKIEQYIEAHKQEMLDDICTLCSINSERSAYQEGDPFGEGPSRALLLSRCRAGCREKARNCGLFSPLTTKATEK